MAEVTETVDQMRRNRWLPGRSDYYMCGKPGYMVRDCLEDTEAVVATVDGQEEVVATRWSQGPLYDKHLKLQRQLCHNINTSPTTLPTLRQLNMIIIMKANLLELYIL
ncbi:hypothetical protein IGI04_031309 [Brassica rapa subsp. trilocularis]|uniref:CCHC-type domain-containing protein n=1 Tax=Brassica rapa subsp. trilocularis TaxID=1813537 RepID=A0ABQ7LT79_BRACM|nr:hypothetical protein IGI04_031309 [Brassica rapa subsp. trilocularis]